MNLMSNLFNLGPALNIIKEFEGLSLKAYLDPVGIWTIGYGHTRDVDPGQHITQQQAEDFLTREVSQFAFEVDKLVTAKIGSKQFCALVSFAYNVGSGALAGSTLLRELNARYPKEIVAAQFGLWIHGRGNVVLPGLVRRRLAERNLFLS